MKNIILLSFAILLAFASCKKETSTNTSLELTIKKNGTAQSGYEVKMYKDWQMKTLIETQKTNSNGVATFNNLQDKLTYQKDSVNGYVGTFVGGGAIVNGIQEGFQYQYFLKEGVNKETADF